MAILKEGSKIKDKEIATKEDLEKINSQYEETAKKIDEKQNKLEADRIRKITFGTGEPTGGKDGDIYFQYE